MNIVERLNALYTIKFTEQFECLQRGNREYYILNTFDDKKYLFKSYKRNTNNTTKLKDSNDVSHHISKQIFLFSDYVVSKEYDPIVEIDEDTIGTLFSHSDGEFLTPDRVGETHIKKLAQLSVDFHKSGYDLIEQSFTINQIENVGSVTNRQCEKMRVDFEDNGIHYLLENKFGVKLELDLVNLNLSHVEKVISSLDVFNPTVLNMDANFENITFGKDESGSEVITNVIIDRVLLGHPVFEMAKSISRLSVFLNRGKISDLKKIFLEDIEDRKLFKSEILDTLIDFYLINMFYKYVKNETFRENQDLFEVLKTKLIKMKFLTFA